MSVRTFIEFNHDFLYKMKDHPEDFLKALDALLRKNPAEYRHSPERFGLIRRGERHHSDSFEVRIAGFVQSQEDASKKW